MNLFLFGFTKTKMGAKTELHRHGRAPQLSARVNQGTLAAAVIGHMYIQQVNQKTYQRKY